MSYYHNNHITITQIVDGVRVGSSPSALPPAAAGTSVCCKASTGCARLPDGHLASLPTRGCLRRANAPVDRDIRHQLDRRHGPPSRGGRRPRQSRGSWIPAAPAPRSSTSSAGTPRRLDWAEAGIPAEVIAGWIASAPREKEAALGCTGKGSAGNGTFASRGIEEPLTALRDSPQLLGTNDQPEPVALCRARGVTIT